MLEKILHSESGNVHYWISNTIRKESLSLFFLHGLTASHDLFVNQIGYFEKDYNVIVWDAPAHGMSRPYRGFSYEKAANDVMKILKLIDGYSNILKECQSCILINRFVKL